MSESVSLTPSEAMRYGRHLVLPEVGPEGQRKLKGSSALIVGIGGLGTPAAVYLASAGVGRLGIVDHDIVELPNLQRQFLFTEEDIGRRKVDVAVERLRLTNPNIKVEAFAEKLDSGNALEVIRGYNVVIDATDNLPTRYLVNDACVMLGKPDVYAAVLGFDGQASVFWAKEGPCYRCLYPIPPPPESVRSCEDSGVLGVLPGVMGGLQAVQAIQILLGKGSPLIGRLVVFNGLDTSFDEVRIKKDSSCPVCGASPSIKGLIDYEEFCGVKRNGAEIIDEMDPLTLKARMDSGRDVLLLDVREPYEHTFCAIKDSKLISLGELSTRLGELEKGRETVVYCHTGQRSATAAEILRQAGFQRVWNLTGGIKAWGQQVDAKMPMY